MTKHADAKHVRVEVGAENGRARLVVEDDGRGFPPGQSQDGEHFGLRMLGDLARDAGGELEIASTPGRGSRVSVEVAR